MFKFREVEKHFDAEDRMPKKINIAVNTIKPETGMTVYEARKFIDNLFA